MGPNRKRTFSAGKEAELLARKKKRLSDDKVTEMLYDSDSEGDRFISDSENESDTEEGSGHWASDEDQELELEPDGGRRREEIEEGGHVRIVQVYSVGRGGGSVHHDGGGGHDGDGSRDCSSDSHDDGVNIDDPVLICAPYAALSFSASNNHCFVLRFITL